MITITDTRYDLTPEEVNKVQFLVRLIDNRQERPSYYKPGVGAFVESYAGAHRRDMFWIECFFGETDLGSLVVEPNFIHPVEFAINRNYNKVSKGYQDLKHRARHWFTDTSEYQQQIVWAQALAKMIEKDRLDKFEDTLVKN